MEVARREPPYPSPSPSPNRRPSLPQSHLTVEPPQARMHLADEDAGEGDPTRKYRSRWNLLHHTEADVVAVAGVPARTAARLTIPTPPNKSSTRRIVDSRAVADAADTNGNSNSNHNSLVLLEGVEVAAEVVAEAVAMAVRRPQAPSSHLLSTHRVHCHPALPQLLSPCRLLASPPVMASSHS